MRSFRMKSGISFCFGILYSVSSKFFEMACLYIKSCWLAALDQDWNFSAHKPMLWSFLLPVALILLFNISIFIKITVIWKKNKNLTRWDGIGLLRSFSKCIPHSLVTSSDFLATNSDFWQNLLLYRNVCLKQSENEFYCCDGSDFVQVHINEHISGFCPLFFWLQWHSTWTKFILDLNQQKWKLSWVQPNKHYEFLSTPKCQASSLAALKQIHLPNFTSTLPRLSQAACHRSCSIYALLIFQARWTGLPSWCTVTLLSLS